MRKIEDLETGSLTEGSDLFFDANIWIFYIGIIFMRLTQDTFQSKGRKPDDDRWNRMKMIADKLDEIARIPPGRKPRIHMTSALQGEILSWWKFPAAKAHFNTHNPQSYWNQGYIKGKYWHSQEYQGDLIKLTGMLETRFAILHAPDDNLAAETWQTIQDYHLPADHNDVLYYLYCKQHNVALVTDDQDFAAVDTALQGGVALYA